MSISDTGRATHIQVAHGTEAGDVPPAPSGPIASWPSVHQVVPLRRDTAYDLETDKARMPVEIQFADGSTVRTEMILNPSQLHAAGVQIERAILTREAAHFHPSGPS
ncbi:hypothetical protein [Streptomyces sp. NPDC002221]|uniref:hypothetical protein n=1 Tax=Streptomyces sp. NPDC002221 TaxID=3364639 RepID=UPI00369FF626